MAYAGINCCSKCAGTNVFKDFKCFNEHANMLLLERLLNFKNRLKTQGHAWDVLH